jgi:nucleotide-binding universal stress UspA family protein
VVKEFSKILVPTDFSEASQRALEYALTFAVQFDLEIKLLHVVDSRSLQPLPYAYDQPSEEDLAKISQQDMAEEVKKVLQKELDEGLPLDHKLKVHTAVRFGLPHDQIVKAAEEERVDFIVMGAQGASALEDAFLGSVTNKVSHKAPCPVFIVRRRRSVWGS